MDCQKVPSQITKKEKKEDNTEMTNIIRNVLNIKNVDVLETVRLGPPAKNIVEQRSPRPLQVVLPSQYLKKKVLKAASNLSKHPRYSAVNLKEDRTPF